MKKTFFLINPQIQLNAAKFVQGLPTDAGHPLMVVIQEPTRNSEQNALLHGMLGELAIKATWGGEKRSADAWKVLMVSAHAIAEGQPCELVKGLEGELVNIRESTAKMSVKRLSSLIEYIQAWAAINEITFTYKG